MKYAFILACFVYFLAMLNSAGAADNPNCGQHNGSSCETCLKEDVNCLWCNSGKYCINYPVKHVIPTSADCPLSAARWGVCWLNFEAMIISVSIIGGLLLIGLTFCLCKCCHCCCFKKKRPRYEREEAQLEAQRQTRKMRQDERRNERKQRNDEIRRKYGLSPSSGPQYQKFENE